VAALQSELAAQSSEAKRHEDVLLLLLAWRCHAGTLWTFTRDEFVLMCMQYGVSTLAAIAALMTSDAAALLGDMSGDDDAVELYNFAFEYLRDDNKVLLVEEACVAWELLLKPKQWALYDAWLAFVRAARTRRWRAIRGSRWCRLRGATRHARWQLRRTTPRTARSTCCSTNSSSVWRASRRAREARKGKIDNEIQRYD
jgi:hypothetical protein